MTDEFSVMVTKLLQGLVSHQLTAYLSVFNPFLTQWIVAMLPKGCKPDSFEPNNSLKLSLTRAFVPILSNVNLSLNQTLYMQQTSTTQLILAISLWGVIFI